MHAKHVIIHKKQTKTTDDMNQESIRFALAVDQEEQFKAKHFGDADNYLIYEHKGNQLVQTHSLSNSFKELDEEHGSRKKGEAIIELLKQSGVKVLVSRQFGRNIKIVNHHFIPVIVYADQPAEIIPILLKHIKWIEEEIENKPEAHKLFTIMNGVLKTAIKA